MSSKNPSVASMQAASNDSVWMPIRRLSEVHPETAPAGFDRGRRLSLDSGSTTAKRPSWTSWEEGARKVLTQSIVSAQSKSDAIFLAYSTEDEDVEESEAENRRLEDEEIAANVSSAMAANRKPGAKKLADGVKTDPGKGPKRGPSLKRWLQGLEPSPF
jgi:hypothetical protein